MTCLYPGRHLGGDGLSGRSPDMEKFGRRRVRLGLFSASAVTPVARSGGHFAAHGLAVAEEAVTSSRAQFHALLAGAYDLVLTSPDNVLAYRLDAANPLGGTHDVRIIAAVDRGLGLSLVGAPGVRTREDVRGRTVAVDVPGSGFAYTLYRLLATAGLRRDVDYRVESAGTTPRRREALLAAASHPDGPRRAPRAVRRHHAGRRARPGRGARRMPPDRPRHRTDPALPG